MDDLLQEISQAQKYGNDRNKEFQAQRAIRRFIAESKPYLMQDLFSLTEERIKENKSDDDIALLKMMLVLLKKRGEV